MACQLADIQHRRGNRPLTRICSTQEMFREQKYKFSREMMNREGVGAQRERHLATATSRPPALSALGKSWCGSCG